jgi:carboxypeptidase PM20D1
MALESMFKRGFTPSCDIYLALGHDEELGGGEGAKILAKYFAHQGIRFSLVLDEGGFISDGALPLNKPVADVCVAEKGIMDVTLSASAPGGHSSRPPGQTAASQLCEAVCRICFRPRPARLIPLVKDNLRTIAPWLDAPYRRYIASPRIYGKKILRHLCASDRTAALARTTIAATMLNGGIAANVLPTSSGATLNIRLLPGDDPEGLIMWIKALTRDLGVKAEVVFSEATSSPPDYKSAAFNTFSQAVRDVFPGIPIVPGLLSGASDARHYIPFSDTVIRFSPFILSSGELASAHAENERVAVASLGAAVQFYRRVIERFCSVNNEQLTTDTGQQGAEDLKTEEDVL